jgi:hypothetical protein
MIQELSSSKQIRRKEGNGCNCITILVTILDHRRKSIIGKTLDPAIITETNSKCIFDMVIKSDILPCQCLYSRTSFIIHTQLKRDCVKLGSEDASQRAVVMVIKLYTILFDNDENMCVKTRRIAHSNIL